MRQTIGWRPVLQTTTQSVCFARSLGCSWWAKGVITTGVIHHPSFWHSPTTQLTVIACQSGVPRCHWHHRSATQNATIVQPLKTPPSFSHSKRHHRSATQNATIVQPIKTPRFVLRWRFCFNPEERPECCPLKLYPGLPWPATERLAGGLPPLPLQ